MASSKIKQKQKNTHKQNKQTNKTILGTIFKASKDIHQNVTSNYFSGLEGYLKILLSNL